MALTRPRAYQIYDIDYKQAVRVVTVSNVTLSGGAPNSVDGVTLSLNDRVLVTAQSTGSQNGIYYVTTLGTGANGTWARSIDTDATGELLGGTIVMVTEGTVYADTQWKLTTNDPITIGSTALTFVQNYLANSINAGLSNVAIGGANANVTVGVNGTSNVAVFSSTGVAVTGTISANGNVTGGNILTGGLISATGNATVGNISATIGTFTTFTSSQGGNVTGTLIATSSNAQFFNQTNSVGFFSAAGNILGNLNLSVVGNITGGNLATGGTASATGNITGGNILTAGLISATGNISGGNINLSGNIVDTGALSIITGSNGNIALAPNGTGIVTASGAISAAGNVTGGNILTGGLISATGNVTGGNLVTGGTASATGNITGGNILTVGQISATGTITTAAGTNSTGFAVGNGAVSNVGLGFFPTAGTRGDYAIRDYSTVFSTIYLDVGMGSSAGGEFQFRSSNAFSLLMRANSSGVYTPGIMSATGIVYGSELNSTNSQTNEGGQINLALPSSGSTLSTSVIIDVFQNRLRFFEGGGTARGAYIDLTSCSAGAGTNLLAGGGGGTPGGSNTQVQFNDGGTFGGNGQFTYNKVTNTLTAGIIAANTNGAGTNFQVGDDAWIGDINVADTMSIRGQQNAANGYIVFGNANGAQLGRAGTGPLTYAGAFSASGNITGGNILTAGLISATGNITGGGLVGTLFTNSIVNTGANGTGNIGSASLYFNTAFVKATSAQYADLAEMYVADQNYTPGTVVVFGGTEEITITNTSHDTRVAGIISTNPSYLMNSGQSGNHVLPVALTGRVPCRVVGPVQKGDRLVSSEIPGVAQVLDSSQYQPGAILGKSLEDWSVPDVGTIEVAVGRT